MPVRLLFEDEGRFGRISDTRRCWVPLPHRAVVGQQVVREYLYSVATVCPQDGSVVALILPWVDAETMSLFLQHAAAEYPGEFCLLFLDRAAWHCAGALQVPVSMRLVFLPPYSPELNPVEHLWDHLRENYFADVTVFNPQQILDGATFEKPFEPPAGIPWVIVNGVLAVENGTPTKSNSGRALRHVSK